ncbi:hypothetical protein ACWF9G_08775 [Nocardia sp. NPDC055029]|uniref:hypothetical protein n=1 Tax=Nocardia sp. NPDC060259 TaxID=3347088 RepID=UPI0036540D21
MKHPSTDPPSTKSNKRLAAQGPTSTGRATTTRKHDYAFKSLIIHRTCGRRMQGNWNHGTAHYRCRYPTEYALANNIDHPSTVYLREDRIIGPLDEWLTRTFAPGRIEHDLAASPTTPSPHTPAIDEAEARLAQQHHKLDKYRDALETSADPELVAQWTREVLGELHSTEARLMAMQQQGSTADSGGKHEIDDINGYLNQILDDLRRAEPADKPQAYRELGLRLTYSDTPRRLSAHRCRAPHPCRPAHRPGPRPRAIIPRVQRRPRAIGAPSSR